MWQIASIDLSRVPGTSAAMSDGQDVTGVTRGENYSSYRLMLSGLGWLDITDLGQQAGSPPWLIMVQSMPYRMTAQAATMRISVDPTGVCKVSGDGNALTVNLTPLPEIDPGDLDVFAQMQAAGFVPYSEQHPGERPYSEVEPQAAAMFAWSADANALGLAVYDWTTADFFRMQMINYYRYTAYDGEPLSEGDIVQAIWAANWPPYSHADRAFMASMLMAPADSEAQVQTQYEQVAGQLETWVDALKRVTTIAIYAMPRTSVMAVPTLFSGQVDISTLGPEALAVLFEEFPGNAGPPPAPMRMPLMDALNGFMAPGNMVTLKSFLSTTNDENGAIKYANGILLRVHPAPNATWTHATYVTPLSDEADKTEYLLRPGSRLAIDAWSEETIGGKQLVVVDMTEVGPVFANE